MIALDPQDVRQTLERTRQMTEQIRAAVSRRVLIYPSGFEVRLGLIQDTNSPYIKDELARRGFHVTIGDVLEDDQQSVAYALREAVNQGYGLVITTGGVGAESKDHSIEGLLQVDPTAATPWLVMYEKGQGRHVKEGVRIAVGQLGPTTFIALPGPNDEVRTALAVILPHLEGGIIDKQGLAEEIAVVLRGVLKSKMREHHF
jgi:molybdenum cofactor synthesis domain-containing protein